MSPYLADPLVDVASPGSAPSTWEPPDPLIDVSGSIWEPPDPIDGISSPDRQAISPEVATGLTSERLTWTDAFQNIREHPLSYVPFLNMYDLVDSGKLLSASHAVQSGIATIEQQKLVTEDLNKRGKSKSLGYKVFDTALHMLSYGIEFLTGTGLLKAGSKKLAVSGLKSGTKVGARSLAVKVGKYIAQDAYKKGAALTLKQKALKLTGHAAARGALLPLTPPLIDMVFKSQMQRMMPHQHLSKDELDRLWVITTDEGDGFWKALAAGYSDTFIETFTEQLGEHVGLMGDWLGSRNSTQAVKAALLNRASKTSRDGLRGILYRYFVKPATTGFGKFARRTGWNGVIGEMYEERVGDLLRSGVGLQPIGQALPSLSDLLAEGLAFAINPIMMAGIAKDVATGKVSPDQYQDNLKVVRNLVRKPALSRAAHVDAVAKIADTLDKEKSDPWYKPIKALMQVLPKKRSGSMAQLIDSMQVKYTSLMYRQAEEKEEGSGREMLDKQLPSMFTYQVAETEADATEIRNKYAEGEIAPVYNTIGRILSDKAGQPLYFAEEKAWSNKEFQDFAKRHGVIAKLPVGEVLPFSEELSPEALKIDGPQALANVKNAFGLEDDIDAHRRLQLLRRIMSSDAYTSGRMSLRIVPPVLYTGTAAELLDKAGHAVSTQDSTIGKKDGEPVYAVYKAAINTVVTEADGKKIGVVTIASNAPDLSIAEDVIENALKTGIGSINLTGPAIRWNCALDKALPDMIKEATGREKKHLEAIQTMGTKKKGRFERFIKTFLMMQGWAEVAGINVARFKGVLDVAQEESAQFQEYVEMYAGKDLVQALAGPAGVKARVAAEEAPPVEVPAEEVVPVEEDIEREAIQAEGEPLSEEDQTTFSLIGLEKAVRAADPNAFKPGMRATFPDVYGRGDYTIRHAFGRLITSLGDDPLIVPPVVVRDLDPEQTKVAYLDALNGYIEERGRKKKAGRIQLIEHAVEQRREEIMPVGAGRAVTRIDKVGEPTPQIPRGRVERTGIGETAGERNIKPGTEILPPELKGKPESLEFLEEVPTEAQIIQEASNESGTEIKDLTEALAFYTARVKALEQQAVDIEAPWKKKSDARRVEKGKGLNRPENITELVKPIRRRKGNAARMQMLILDIMVAEQEGLEEPGSPFSIPSARLGIRGETQVRAITHYERSEVTREAPETTEEYVEESDESRIATEVLDSVLNGKPVDEALTVIEGNELADEAMIAQVKEKLNAINSFQTALPSQTTEFAIALASTVDLLPDEAERLRGTVIRTPDGYNVELAKPEMDESKRRWPVIKRSFALAKENDRTKPLGTQITTLVPGGMGKVLKISKTLASLFGMIIPVSKMTRTHEGLQVIEAGMVRTSFPTSDAMMKNTLPSKMPANKAVEMLVYDSTWGNEEGIGIEGLIVLFDNTEVSRSRRMAHPDSRAWQGAATGDVPYAIGTYYHAANGNNVFDADDTLSLLDAPLVALNYRDGAFRAGFPLAVTTIEEINSMGSEAKTAAMRGIAREIWEWATENKVHVLGLTGLDMPTRYRDREDAVYQTFGNILDMAFRSNEEGIRHMPRNLSKTSVSMPIRPRRGAQHQLSPPSPGLGVAPSESVTGRNLGTIPMYYKMPALGVREDLRADYPGGTTTATLMADDNRTATTRRKFGNVGDTFQVGADTYRITSVASVDLESAEGKAQWSQREGWDADYAMQAFPNQVRHGATQTVFEKVVDQEQTTYALLTDLKWEMYGLDRTRKPGVDRTVQELAAGKLAYALYDPDVYFRNQTLADIRRYYGDVTYAHALAAVSAIDATGTDEVTESLVAIDELSKFILPSLNVGATALHREFQLSTRNMKLRIFRDTALAEKWRQSIGLPARPMRDQPFDEMPLAEQLLWAIGARLEDSDEIIAHVRMTEDGKPIFKTEVKVLSAKEITDKWDATNPASKKMPTSTELINEIRDPWEERRQQANDDLADMSDDEWIHRIESYVSHWYRPKDYNKDKVAAAKTIAEDAPQAQRRAFFTLGDAYHSYGWTPVTMDATQLFERWARSVWKAQRNRRVLGIMPLVRDVTGAPQIVPVRRKAVPKGVTPPMSQLTLKEAAINLAEYINAEGGTATVDPAADPQRQINRLVHTNDMTALGYKKVVSPWTQSVNEFWVYQGTAEKVLSMLIDKRWESDWITAVEHVNQWSKYMAIGFSGFHFFSLLESMAAVYGLTMENPALPWNMRKTYTDLKDLYRKVQENPEQYYEWIEDGLQVDWGNPDVNLTLVDADWQRSLDWMRDQGGTAWETAYRASSFVFDWKRKWDHFLWREFHPMLKLHTSQMVYERLQENYEARGIPLDKKQMRENIARYINDAFGGQEFESYIWATPHARQMLNLLLFAPDWTLSAANVSGITLVPGISNVVKPNTSILAGNEMLRRYWPAMASIVLVGVPAAVQAAIYMAFGDPDEDDKPFPFLNEVDKRTWIDLTPLCRKLGWVPAIGYKGGDSGKRRVFMRWGKQAYEVFDGWLTKPYRTLLNKSSAIMRTAFEQVTGSTPSGWELPFKDEGLSGIFTDGDSWTRGRAAYVGRKFMPYGLLAMLEGRATTFFAPAARGTTIGKATAEMTEILEAYANDEMWAKITKAEKTNDLAALVPQWVEAAERNGVNAEEALKRATSSVRAKYYLQFYRALNKGNTMKLEQLAASIIRLNGSVDTTVLSMERRYKSQTKEFTEETRKTIEQSFGNAF